jgi:hypothetical protein
MDRVESESVLPWLNAPMIRTSSVGRELDLNRIDPTNTEEPQRTGGIRCVVSRACSGKKFINGREFVPQRKRSKLNFGSTTCWCALLGSWRPKLTRS